MSEAVNLLIEDYAKKRGDLLHIDMKLSTGKELRVFYAPVMNVAQQAEIYKHINLATGEMDSEVFLTALIVRAMNEDGTRMFRDIDRQELKTKVDHSLVQEIIARMGGVTEAVDPKA